MLLLLLVAAVLMMFLVTVFMGAPYVPTHRAAIKTTLAMLPLKKGELVVDLGSGDGAFLVAAAKQGLSVIGYEINLVLWLVSFLRCLPYKERATVHLANFWRASLPPKTAAVFVFLAGPYMQRFAKKLHQTMQGRNEPLFVVSYGFEVSGLKLVKAQDGVFLYKLSPTARG
jgi:hypothetical protein